MLLQRAISEYLRNLKAARARYIAHFERMEKSVLLKMARDKSLNKISATADAEQKGGRKRRDTVYPDLDWSKLSGELRRMTVGACVRSAWLGA